MKPNARPSAILNVSGIMMMVKKAGTTSVKSSKLMRVISVNMKAPTRMRAGAVAKGGTIATNGANRSAIRNKPATTRAVSPVFPPSAIPVVFSR
ncbi:hypothetical protein D1872_196160 [compost metagenome]